MDNQPSIEINGMKFTPLPGVQYRFDYIKMAEEISAGKYNEIDAYRTLFQEDSFALLFFVRKIQRANHPFIVQACRDVDLGPKDATLDLWGREHFKSTILTETGIIKSILNDPSRSHGILSYSRALAQSFLINIKQVLEGSQILKDCFPDILYQEPQKESEAWGVESGLLVKRNVFKKERTVEAWGLIDGQPVGRHFDERIYDDIVTWENSQNPEQQMKVLDAFMMSHNLGSEGGNHRVIGTPYHYADAINSIRQMKRNDGSPLYCIRLKPSLLNGDPNGEPVLLSPDRIEFLRQDEQKFFSQHLLDPTPKGNMKLDPNFLQEIEPEKMPRRLYKFMTVDSAGSAIRREDSWAILVLGVEPLLDDSGGCNVYLLDACVEPMQEHIAIDKIVEMYKRHGRIEKIGIEKVGIASTEVHVANALRAAGKHVSIESGTLEILKPGGRKKEDRILRNLQWPLNNSKIWVSNSVPYPYRQRLKMEMEKFPFASHDDFVDAFSYIYDILADYRFPKRWTDVATAKTIKVRDYGEWGDKEGKRDWMIQ